LKGVAFPNGLQWLDLGGNNIRLLKGVVFPDGLQVLGLRENKIQESEKQNLPKNTTLHL
jgi:Leucine-rich repeat (LRR) protein